MYWKRLPFDKEHMREFEISYWKSQHEKALTKYATYDHYWDVFNQRPHNPIYFICSIYCMGQTFRWCRKCYRYQDMRLFYELNFDKKKHE